MYGYGYGYPMYGYQGGCGNDGFSSWWAIIIVIFVIFFVFCGNNSNRGIGNC